MNLLDIFLFAKIVPYILSITTYIFIPLVITLWAKEKIFVNFYDKKTIFIIMISILFFLSWFYCITYGYKKVFFVHVKDEKNCKINTYSIYDETKEILKMSDKYYSDTKSKIEINNINLPTTLYVKHGIYKAKRDVNINNFIEDSKLTFTLSRNYSEIFFNDKKKNFTLLRNRLYCVNDDSIDLILNNTHDNYIKIDEKIDFNKDKFEIRLKYSLIDKYSSLLINIDDSIKIYIGEQSLNIVRIESKSPIDGKWATIKSITMANLLQLNRINFLSLSLSQNNDDTYELTLSDNEALEESTLLKNIFIDKKPKIKIGCYGNNKGRIMRLYYASIITDKNTEI